MYALYVMGQYLEPMLGRARYIALYLLSAFGGSVGILLLASKPAGGVVTLADESWFTAAVGASGAVFGLFGAFLVLQRRLGRSAAGMYVVIGINAVIGFVIPGIAWQAHLGGLITGAVAAAAIGYLGRAKDPLQPPDRRIHWVALGGLFVVLVLLSWPSTPSDPAPQLVLDAPAAAAGASRCPPVVHRHPQRIHALFAHLSTGCPHVDYTVSFIPNGDNPCGQLGTNPQNLGTRCGRAVHDRAFGPVMHRTPGLHHADRVGAPGSRERCLWTAPASTSSVSASGSS